MFWHAFGFLLGFLSWLGEAQDTYNNGQWTPTTSYQSVWVASTTWSTYVAYVTQANAVVTVTSYIPCPVTSTTWVYQCGSCQTTAAPAPAVQVGTTTQTLYTTVTPAQSVQYITTTSSGYVVVVPNPTTAQAIVNPASRMKPLQLSTMLALFLVLGILIL